MEKIVKQPSESLEERVRELEAELEKQRTVEQALRFEKNTLERFTRSIGAGIAHISKDYRTLWANRVLVDLFGDVVGKPCYLTYNGKKDVCSGCGVREVFEKGVKISTHEQMGYDADGQTIWSQLIATPLYDEQGRVESALEVVMPITERKRAEEFVRRERLFSDALISSLPGVMYLLRVDGSLKRWNRNMARVCGYTTEEMAALPPYALIAKRDRDMVIQQLKVVLDKGEGMMEVHLVSRDGREIPYLFSGVRMEINGDLYVVGTGMDMTRRLADARQKEELIAKLRETLARVRTLSGMLPICSTCKKIRDDKGYWNQIESYIKAHSDAEFSHSICPDCLVRLYPEEAATMARAGKGADSE